MNLRCDEPAPPATDQLREAAHALLDQLRWWGLALRGGHAACPHVS
ncbi:hypothetical protein [Micromonospora sp. KC606]|nr:hypothetical protein [Micromonospora sp. KC606]